MGWAFHSIWASQQVNDSVARIQHLHEHKSSLLHAIKQADDDCTSYSLFDDKKSALLV